MGEVFRARLRGAATDACRAAARHRRCWALPGRHGPWRPIWRRARGGDEQKAAKLWAYRDPEGFGYLLDILGECVAFHLIGQLDAGADAVQIFDSWASGLPDRRCSNGSCSSRPARSCRRYAQPDPRRRSSDFRAQRPWRAMKRMRARPVWMRCRWTRRRRWTGRRRRLDAWLQGNLDPIVLIAGGAAWTGRWTTYWKRRQARRSSSIWATAFSRRRRSRMSSSC